MKKNVIYVTLIVLLCVGVIYSCSKKSAPAPAKTSDDTKVEIENFAFSPASITVKPGTVVTWTNKDSAPHTVTAVSGATFDSGSIATNGTFKFTFKTAGTYTYHCTIHSMMATATVVVSN